MRKIYGELNETTFKEVLGQVAEIIPTMQSFLTNIEQALLNMHSGDKCENHLKMMENAESFKMGARALLHNLDTVNQMHNYMEHGAVPEMTEAEQLAMILAEMFGMGGSRGKPN